MKNKIIDCKKQPYKGLIFYFAGIVVADIWLSALSAVFDIVDVTHLTS